MKKKEQDYYGEAIQILKELNKAYPSHNMGRHLSTALLEYPNIWDLTDKELVFALTKYKVQMELEEPTLATEDELAEIIKNGMNLTMIPDEDFINGQDY